MKTHILTITIPQRDERVATVQNILSEYADYVQARLGLHNAFTCCENNGLIIMVLHCELDVIKTITQKLEKIDSISVKSMELECK